MPATSAVTACRWRARSPRRRRRPPAPRAPGRRSPPGRTRIVAGDVVEDRRLEEPARAGLRIGAALPPAATAMPARAGAPSTIAGDLGELRRRVDRAQRRSRRPWPIVSALRPRDQPLDELVVDARARSRSREPAEQICPAFSKIAPSTPSTAASRSASASTTTGDLPPSSSITVSTLSAAARITPMPVATEPVKVTCRTSGCATSGAPASRAGAGDDVDDARRQPGLAAAARPASAPSAASARPA